MGGKAGFESEGAYVHPNLIAGDFPRVEDVGTIASGNNLVAGAVLALNSSTGFMAPVDTTLTTNAQDEPYAVLAEDVDASAANTPAVVYLAGCFNEAVLTYGGDDGILNHKAALRAVGIYTKSNLGA